MLEQLFSVFSASSHLVVDFYLFIFFSWSMSLSLTCISWGTKDRWIFSDKLFTFSNTLKWWVELFAFQVIKEGRLLIPMVLLVVVLVNFTFSLLILGGLYFTFFEHWRKHC